MLEQALTNEIGKNKKGDNLLLNSLGYLLLWVMGKKKKKEIEKEYSLEDAVGEVFTRKASDKSSGSSSVMPYVS